MSNCVDQEPVGIRWRPFVVTNSFVQIVENLRSYNKDEGLTKRMNSLLRRIAPTDFQVRGIGGTFSTGQQRIAISAIRLLVSRFRSALRCNPGGVAPRYRRDS